MSVPKISMDTIESTYMYAQIHIVKIRVFEMHVLVISFNIHFRDPLQCVVIIAVVALTEPVVGG